MGENSIKSPITLSNLDELKRRRARIDGLSACEIRELAFDFIDTAVEMLNGDYGIYEVLSFVSEELSTLSLSPADAVEFARSLFSLLSEKRLAPGEADFLFENHEGGRVALLKNPLSIEAYEVFSQDIKAPRVLYRDSVSAVGEALKASLADYCILPLEEKGGVRVSRVSELIFKSDLKINKVTPVFGPLGNADVLYALISKSFSVPSLERDDDRYLEIRVSRDGSIPLSELLFAAEAFGLTLYRVNQERYLEFSEWRDYYSLVFKTEGESFATFLTYLTLFSGDFTPIGIYKNLE